MKRILIDSGPLIALFDSSDRYHQKAIEFIKNNRCLLFTTIASITETLHLLDFNRNAQIDFIEWVAQGGVHVSKIQQPDFLRIKELIVTYQDLPMDFADACLVLLAEKTKIDVVVTVNRDFTVYRIEGAQPFTTIVL